MTRRCQAGLRRVSCAGKRPKPAVSVLSRCSKWLQLPRGLLRASPRRILCQSRFQPPVSCAGGQSVHKSPRSLCSRTARQLPSGFWAHIPPPPPGRVTVATPSRAAASGTSTRMPPPLTASFKTRHPGQVYGPEVPPIMIYLLGDRRVAGMCSPS